MTTLKFIGLQPPQSQMSANFIRKERRKKKCWDLQKGKKASDEKLTGNSVAACC